MKIPAPKGRSNYSSLFEASNNLFTANFNGQKTLQPKIIVAPLNTNYKEIVNWVKK